MQLLGSQNDMATIRLCRGQPFLWDRRCRRPLAAYPGAARATPTLPYLALPRMRFAMPSVLPRPRWALTPAALARRRRALRRATISTLPDLVKQQAASLLDWKLTPVKAPRSLKRDFAALRRQSQGEPSAVCFLLHCLSPRGARPLAGILLYGARTFLQTQGSSG